MLPLAAGQGVQVYGIIELFGKAEASFSESDIELVQSLAAQAATAIENARLFAEVQRLATMDELTGLLNRRGFYKQGQLEWERSQRLKHPLAVLFIDIDHFKQFNDAYSYTVGDQVLRLLAGCLRSHVREIDLVGRYGGEEFVLLLPETNLYSGNKVADRVRRSVETLQVSTGHEEVNITVSIGICQKMIGMATLENFIDHAGQALHEAKDRGRNRISIYSGQNSRRVPSVVY
jgi:diguanylate cyclase (GGDEF)-like protein